MDSKLTANQKIHITKPDKETCADAKAAFSLNPAVNSALVIDAFSGTMLGEDLDLSSLINTIESSVNKVKSGDLSTLESILVSQSFALQGIFTSLARRASNQTLTSNYQSLLSLALKAQSQCRTTLETLSALKHPSIIYAKQANVTTGPQQINNGVMPSPQAGEIKNEQTQLSGGIHELLPDTRTSSHAFRNDQALEALGEIDGAEVSSRQRDIS
jgi:hypothetical protein